MNILLVDDHAIFRESMISMLNQCYAQFSIWQAENGKQTLDILRMQQMDLILLDLRLPDITGIDLLQQLHTVQATPILILAASDNPHDMQQCIDLGARGYICKTAPFSQLQEAIRDVMDGKIYLPELLMNSCPQLQKDMEIINNITMRQKKVLELLHRGKRNKEIARKLNISEATVKVHTRTLFRMLGVNNRHSAVQEGLRLRLLKV
jgi:DNA-binding NarL/FixJ family response regulator